MFISKSMRIFALSIFLIPMGTQASIPSQEKNLLEKLYKYTYFPLGGYLLGALLSYISPAHSNDKYAIYCVSLGSSLGMLLGDYVKYSKAQIENAYDKKQAATTPAYQSVLASRDAFKSRGLEGPAKVTSKDATDSFKSALASQAAQAKQIAHHTSKRIAAAQKANQQAQEEIISFRKQQFQSASNKIKEDACQAIAIQKKKVQQKIEQRKAQIKNAFNPSVAYTPWV